jgi:C1A family cysteine protease
MTTPAPTTTLPQARQTKRMGWLPDLPDNRDHVFKPRRALPRLPSRVDLRTTGFMPGVYDQGYLGSCTANAVAGAFEYEQKRQGLTDFNPARLFIYYEERRMINTLNEDSGAFIRDGLKVVNRLGAPNETLWPYDISASPSAQQPTSTRTGSITRRSDTPRSTTAASSTSSKRWRSASPSSSASPSTHGSNPDAHGFCNPVLNQQVLGGHAVVAVGYFRLKNKWWAIVRNSWGPSWGDSGYCYMPLRWICDYWNADDFWVINQVEAPAARVARRKKAA